MAVNLGDAALARLRAEEGLTLHRELGDPWGAAYAGFMLGHVVGDLPRAQQLYEEGIRVFRELGDEHSALLSTRNLAWTYEELGDLDRARALHEENLDRARSSSNARVEASTLGILADYARKEGRMQHALSMLRESLRIHRDVGDLLDTTVDLCRFAVILASEGRTRTAARLLASVDALGDEIGGRRARVTEMSEEPLKTIRAQLGEAAFAEAWEQGRKLTADDAVALALDSLD